MYLPNPTCLNRSQTGLTSYRAYPGLTWPNVALHVITSTNVVKQSNLD